MSGSPPRRNPALENICARVAADLGIVAPIESLMVEISDLAKRAGVDLWLDPREAADAIREYLDDIAANP
jgi:hypothetical protein